MALDKVVDSAVLDAGMVTVADAIRAKAGISDQLVWPEGFKAAVDGIQTGGGGVEDTVTVTLPIGPVKYNYDMEVTATYTNALGEIVANVPAGKPASYTVKKGSIFFIYGYLKDLSILSSPSLYGVASCSSTDPRFISNKKEGVFFVCDSDVTVVY